MTPIFRIVADGADITTLINDRLLLLRTTDKPAMESDDFELRIDDRDSAVSLHSRRASIEVFLGYSGTAKVADGHLLVMQREGGQSASRTALGTITLTRSDVSRWQFRLCDRSAHKAVSTKHQDKKTGKLAIVTLDNDEAPDGLPPVHTDRHIYPNKSAGEQAAKARLAAFNRSTAGVRLEMPGRTDLFAERTINAQGFKVGLDGEYLVDSVEQVFTQRRPNSRRFCSCAKHRNGPLPDRRHKTHRRLYRPDRPRVRPVSLRPRTGQRPIPEQIRHRLTGQALGQYARGGRRRA